MKAIDIICDIDAEDIYGVLDEMNVYKAAEALGIPTLTYANMTTEERHNYAKELMNLPDTVEIPDGMTDVDEISEWLSDEYGFCHRGFKLS